jgi:TM2 domain-containing membrane protein YozV
VSQGESQQPGTALPQPGVSGDARALMMFEANKKSIAVAYFLWLLFGYAGGHRFYAGKTVSAVAQLLLLIVGAILAVAVVGVFLLIGLAIWVIVDAFLIPGWIRNHNSLLAMQLGRQSF